MPLNNCRCKKIYSALEFSDSFLQGCDARFQIEQSLVRGWFWRLPRTARCRDAKPRSNENGKSDGALPLK